MCVYHCLPPLCLLDLLNAFWLAFVSLTGPLRVEYTPGIEAAGCLKRCDTQGNSWWPDGDHMGTNVLYHVRRLRPWRPGTVCPKPPLFLVLHQPRGWVSVLNAQKYSSMLMRRPPSHTISHNSQHFRTIVWASSRGLSRSPTHDSPGLEASRRRLWTCCDYLWLPLLFLERPGKILLDEIDDVSHVLPGNECWNLRFKQRLNLSGSVAVPVTRFATCNDSTNPTSAERFQEWCPQSHMKMDDAEEVSRSLIAE